MTESFGQYEVVGQVASGATGTVYRARHAELGRDAAIKELSPRLRQVPDQLTRMRHEAEVLSRLESEHIVDLYDYVEEPDRVWIAEQWVEGASLSTILRAHGQLTPEQSVGAIAGALRGLARAHSAGLVHRDVTPGNVLSDLAGISMLVDFGLAAPAGVTEALGTPAYMSPEAVRGEPVGTAGDVYSAAAVLYELLAGQPAFGASDVATTLRRQVEQPAPVLEGFGADLQDLVARSLSKDPAQRPPDAAAFLAELEAAAERRFGSGWLARASIAGVVASVAGAAGAAGGAVLGAASAPPASVASGAAETVVVDSAAISAPAVGPVKAGSTRGLTPVVAGVVVVAAVVGVIVFVLTSGGSADTEDPSTASSGSLGSSPGGSASSEESPEPTVEDLAPTGVYKLVSRVVKTDFPESKVGTVSRRTWTFAPSSCNDARCSGTITSSSGLEVTYTWNGSRLTLKPLKPYVYEGRCIDDVTGEKIPDSHFKATRTYKNSPLVGEAGGVGPPTVLRGTQRTQEVTTELSSGCKDPDGVNHEVAEWTLTQKVG